jgi:hypothetical protein
MINFYKHCKLLENIGTIHKFWQITLNLAQICRYKVITLFLLYRDEHEESYVGIMAYIQAFWNIFFWLKRHHCSCIVVID